MALGGLLWNQDFFHLVHVDFGNRDPNQVALVVFPSPFADRRWEYDVVELHFECLIIFFKKTDEPRRKSND